jgi:hypothetical protein
VCAARSGAATDQLIWHTKGIINAISSDSVTVNRFNYKLTSTTAYEKNGHQTTRSAFAAGDSVQLDFISDHSVLKVEGKSSSDNTASGTPTPVATQHVTKFTAKLAPLGVSTAKGDSVGSYSETQSKFSLTVKVPRNSIPLATSKAEAKELSITATLTRNDELLATCTTAFQTKQSKNSLFEFKTEIEGKGGARSTKVRSLKGKCVLASGARGIPIVRAGDLVTVSEATAGEFLKGDF